MDLFSCIIESLEPLVKALLDKDFELTRKTFENPLELVKQKMFHLMKHLKKLVIMTNQYQV